MPGQAVERFTAPIWRITQKGPFECGAATLLALAAFHKARAVGPATQPPVQQQGDPPRLDDDPTVYELPALKDTSQVLEQWIKPGNLVQQDWAADPVGLMRGLERSVSELGYADRQPNWTAFTAPIDPDFYDTHHTFDPVNKGPTRGAEETVLARVAWQIYNRGIPAALGYKNVAGLHWVTVWGVAGELVPNKLIVHSLRILDPDGDSPAWTDVPVDSTHAICMWGPTPDYWRNQLMAVGNHAPPTPAHPGNQYVAYVNLKPIAMPTMNPVHDRNAMPVGLDASKPALSDHYQAECWKSRIETHAQQNVTVRRRVWDEIEAGRLVVGRPVPVWSEQALHYEFLVPLLTRADGNHEQVALLLLADSKGLVSKIYGPDLGPYRAFFEHTKLLDPQFRAAHPDKVQIKLDQHQDIHTQQLVFPAETRTKGNALPVFQSLVPQQDPEKYVDHTGEDVEFEES